MSPAGGTGTLQREWERSGDRAGAVGAATAAPPAPAVSLQRPALIGLAGMLALVVGSVLGGTAFVSHLPGAWFFGTPGGPLGSLVPPGKDPPVYALLLVFGGLALLTRAWIGLLRQLWRRPGIPVRRVVAVIALWILPLLLAPPLFSRDAYSYAGQGEMVSHHIDPYQYGPGVLAATPFNTLAGPLWQNTPSPYGPVVLGLDSAATVASGHHVLADLVLLRLIALAGLALIVAALPTLARASGRDPAAVVLLAAGSPLVLTTLVGGAHNDALMIGLLLAGLAVYYRVGPVPAIVLCALATGVKAPAALGIAFVGWAWSSGAPTVTGRVRRLLAAGGLAAATLEVLSLVTGLGWGWIGTLGGPGKVVTGVTPVATASRVVADALMLVRVPVTVAGARTVGAVLGLLVASVLALWFLIRSDRLGPVKALGLSLLWFALLGPILWPWYLTWGLVTLAPVAGRRLRAVLVALTVVAAFVGVTAVQGLFHSLVHAGVLQSMLVVAALTAVVSMPLGLPGWWAGAVDRVGAEPNAPETSGGEPDGELLGLGGVRRAGVVHDDVAAVPAVAHTVADRAGADVQDCRA